MDNMLETAQFTGSQTFTRIGFNKSIMSEGVLYVAEKMKAFWLVQDVDLYVARVFLNLSEEFRDSVFRSFENLQEGAGMIDEHAGNILF